MTRQQLFFKEHNRNLNALRQLMQKKNRVESLEDGKFQRKIQSYTCDICHQKGHHQKSKQRTT